MDRMTQPEKVLVLLYRYRTVDPSVKYSAPYEITQNGIGEVLGISRSHVSVILGKLEKEHLVESFMATLDSVPRGTRCRKVYQLTRDGESRCRGIFDDLGMSEDNASFELVPHNINHCRPEAFDSLPDEDRDLLGALMLMRMPVHFETLPRGRDHPLLSVDVKGFVAIRPKVCRTYIERADPHEIARWHSVAADLCASMSSDPTERLVHLIRGNRRREAIKLILCDPYSVMDRPTAEVTCLMDELDLETDDHPLAWIAAFCAVRLNDTKRARSLLEHVGEAEREWIECELLLAEGKKGVALDRSLECYDGSIEAAMALGKSMAANSRHAEAVIFLRHARKGMMEKGCLFRLDEELVWEADSYLAMGDRKAASALTEAAACAVKDEHTGRILMDKAKALVSENLVGLQGVHV